MMKRGIREAGKKLKVSKKDIKDIKKAKRCRIWCWLLKLGIAVIAFIAGYFTGRGSCPSVSEGGGTQPITPEVPPPSPPGGEGVPEGYPYAFIPILATRACKTRKSKIAILLVSALAFFIAIKAKPIFGQAILYNVFKKKRR